MLTFPLKGEVFLDGLVSASNYRNGLELNGSANVKIISGQFSNNNDGIAISLDSGSSLEISTSFIGANGNVGLCVFPSEGIRVKISHSNFTAHYYGYVFVSYKSRARRNRIENYIQVGM